MHSLIGANHKAEQLFCLLGLLAINNILLSFIFRHAGKLFNEVLGSFACQFPLLLLLLKSAMLLMIKACFFVHVMLDSLHF